MQNEPPTPSSTHYRYPGVTPFTTGQAHIFFGRDKDTDDLYRLVRREPLVVLYGKSGLGKSSILNAGIIPRCGEEGTYSPCEVRFGSFTERSDSPLQRIIFALRGVVYGTETGSIFGVTNADGSTLAYGGLTAPSDILEKIKPSGEDSLWYHAKTRQLNGGGSPLLIFDQFEELFSYPEAQVAAFQQELSELLHTGLPLRFRRMADAADNLTDAEEEQLESPLEVRILLAIRSDRMHLLDRLKAWLPNVLRHTFELQALARADARAAITTPAGMAGDFATPPFTYTPEAVDRLMDYLEDGPDKRVEGILVQMLCEYYERHLVAGQGLHILSPQQMGDPEEVVKQYYRSKLGGLPPAHQQRARLLIEEGLVSEGEAMRLTLHESYILGNFKVDKPLLERLIDSRLLRAEPFPRGGYTYELSHDRLVPPVLEARKQRRSMQMWQELEVARQKIEEERTQRQRAEAITRRARQRTRLAVIVSLVAVGLAVVAGWSYRQAQQAEAKAVKEKDKAEQALSDFRREQAAKMKLEFDGLARRASNILEVGGCPKDLLGEMRNIADRHPDSTNLKNLIQFLNDKNPSCR